MKLAAKRSQPTRMLIYVAAAMLLCMLSVTRIMLGLPTILEIAFPIGFFSFAPRMLAL